MSEHWSLGVLIGLPIAIISVVILLGIALAIFLTANDYEASFFSGGFAILAFLVIIGSLFAYWPYKIEYHKWKPITGVVQAVNSRVVPSGESVQEKYVLRVDGTDYGCEDTRCALVKVDQTISLSCKRAYQWASAHGWDCRFYEVK